MVARDGQIERFLVSRYGQFVLLTPKASLGNAVLWVGPLLVVAAGAGVLLARAGEARRRQQTSPPKRKPRSKSCPRRLCCDEIRLTPLRRIFAPMAGDDGKVT